jgi:hypothetical protein
MRGKIVSKLLATAAIVIALTSASARAEDTRPMLLGAGARNGGCGEWISGRFNDVYVSWVLGYISAVNTWANPGVVINITSSMPNVSAVIWAKNWCAANPLEKVGDAALALTTKLSLDLGIAEPNQPTRARPIPPPARSTLRPPDELR